MYTVAPGGIEVRVMVVCGAACATPLGRARSAERTERSNHTTRGGFTMFFI
jgi:hypothetical protein